MADLATTRPDRNGVVKGRSPEDDVLPTVFVENFPALALPGLADELRAFGAEVDFLSSNTGELRHSDGRLMFQHEGDVLMVRVIKKPTYFPLSLLIGGIKQTCEEAAERWRKQNAGN